MRRKRPGDPWHLDGNRGYPHIAFDGQAGAMAWQCERHTLGAVARAVQLLDGSNGSEKASPVFLCIGKKVVELGLYRRIRMGLLNYKGKFTMFVDF